MTRTGKTHEQFTSADAYLIRACAGSSFDPNSTIRLPSGRTITGEEMQRLVAEGATMSDNQRITPTAIGKQLSDAFYSPPPRKPSWPLRMLDRLSDWLQYSRWVFLAGSAVFLVLAVFAPSGVETNAWDALSVGNSAMFVALTALDKRCDCQRHPHRIRIRETE